MVIPRLVSQALAGRPLTVYGDGEQQRCFCHVVDTIEALASMAEVEEAYGRVFNVGSKEETTIYALAERIIDLANSNSEIVLVPYEEAYVAGFEDMNRRIPDLSRINELIGWQPTRKLDDILSDVLNLSASPAGSIPVAGLGE